ncbi:MAG: RNA polymerase sigma factor [Acidobacteria bacterium]|nr:MAG: RNA polymerase sigma factor [Acidobacteriota bacterium]
MASAALLEQARKEEWSDEQVVSRVLAGDTVLYELLMRRYNQRLYRVARAILRDDAEAEDVMQDAYVRAYQHLADFEGRAKFSTWLTRIAVHEALARSRRRSRFQSLDNSEESKGGIMGSLASAGRNPEEAAYDRELGGVLEKAILGLPEDYRLIFMLRDVEGMSTDETAECLAVTPENVKVRLHRARAALRKELYARAGARTVESFQLHAGRCNRIVKNVFRMLGLVLL